MLCSGRGMSFRTTRPGVAVPNAGPMQPLPRDRDGTAAPDPVGRVRDHQGTSAVIRSSESDHALVIMDLLSSGASHPGLATCYLPPAPGTGYPSDAPYPTAVGRADDAGAVARLLVAGWIAVLASSRARAPGVSNR